MESGSRENEQCCGGGRGGKEAKNTTHGITDAMRHEHVVYTLSDLTSTFFTPKGQTEGRLKMTRGKTAL